MNINLLILIIIFLLLFYILNRFLIKNEHYENKVAIHFLSKEKTIKNLLNNNDGYFDKFFKKDLEVRNVSSIDEYKAIIKKCTCNFNNDEQDKIKQAIRNITQKINNIQNNYYKNINIKKLNQIPWVIGLICNNKYENGLPHTRNHIILLSREKMNYYSMNKLEKTLIHEKIHIYQKKHPEEVNAYLDNMGFQKIKIREKNDNIRANPDLDNYIYQDKDHNTYKAVYNTNASTLEDITYYPYDKQNWEHPHEKMAIEFENIINI
jgi:hypothetical protein